MKHRKLRIAWSVVWGLVAVLLIALWVRSSLPRAGWTIMDRLTWHYYGGDAIQIGTIPGQVEFSSFADMPVPAAVAAQADRQWVTEWFDSIRLRDGKTQWWFDVNSAKTSRSVEVPDWFLLLACCGVGGLPWFRRRFSLRTLLIATTLVAVGLGLIVWATRAR